MRRPKSHERPEKRSISRLRPQNAAASDAPELCLGTPLRQEVDRFLAGALRSRRGDWPSHWLGSAIETALIRRVMFHGIAGVLVDDVDLRGWPGPIKSALSRQAQAQAMWEMEHYQLLNEVLAALVKREVKSCFLKGTASAYGYYSKPHQRSRGDTDLLINKADVKSTRATFVDLGFSPDGPMADDVEIAHQECWMFVSQHGFNHLIDLHWQTLNSSYLSAILPASECIEHRVALKSAPIGAYFMGSVHHLLHTCLHRSMHRTAPYFVDGDRYTDLDRLIWAKDICLVAATLSSADWSVLAKLAADRGVSEACADSLRFAKSTMAALIPDEAIQMMSAVSGEVSSNYLLRDGRATRAWRNLRSVPWGSKADYLGRQLFPPASRMRAEYPQYVKLPLIFPYSKRALELVMYWLSPK